MKMGSVQNRLVSEIIHAFTVGFFINGFECSSGLGSWAPLPPIKRSLEIFNGFFFFFGITLPSKVLFNITQFLNGYEI